MYITTGYLRVVALDAATGTELWQFDPLKDHPFPHGPASGGVNRGCAYWSDGMPGGERRIVHGTSDGRLFSLDAKTGKLDPNFAEGGILNLRAKLDPKVATLSYGPTSATALWKNTIIVGVSCGEGPRRRRAGRHPSVRRPHRRARSGGSGPSPGRENSDTRPGKATRGRIAAGPTPGEVSASTSIAGWYSPGSDRPPSTSMAATGTARISSRIARSLWTRRTGKRVWHFQTLHHDLWDHDLPVYPNLVTVNHGGKSIDAVAQVTKTGYVFLFERETGKPLFDIEEKPVPTSDVAGEQASPTQPVPVKPPPFSTQFLDETNVTDIGEANRE